jgi:hypothetical protein
LDTEDEEGDGSDVDDGLGKFGGVFGDVGEGPGGSFFYGGVKFFETDDEGVEGG